MFVVEKVFKKILSKIVFFCLHKIWVKKNLGSKKCFCQKSFWSKKGFKTKIFWQCSHYGILTQKGIILTFFWPVLGTNADFFLTFWANFVRNSDFCRNLVKTFEWKDYLCKDYLFNNDHNTSYDSNLADGVTVAPLLLFLLNFSRKQTLTKIKF